jgi:MFS family permease
MQSVAQAWLVLEITGSGTALGTVMAMQFLPTLFLAPVGGMLADRFDKRNLIIGTQLAAGALAMTLGIITLTGAVELWMVYALAVGFGTVTALDNPSRQTFVMEMVGPDDVSNAVTLNSVVVNAARAVGPAIAGIVIATAGIGQCFIANSLSYIAVVIALLLIRRDELHPSARSVRAPKQLREGFHYAWNTPILRVTLIMLWIIGTLTYEFSTTLPLLSEFTFGKGATGLAIMTSLMGVGAVVGGLVVAASGPPTTRRLVMVAAAFGVSVTAVSAMPTVVMVYALMPFVGAASVATIALSNATLRLNSEPRLRGRVMSLFSMALVGSTPVGGPIVGWIGEHIDPRAAVLMGGIAALVAAGYGTLHLGLRARDEQAEIALDAVTAAR